MTAEARVLVAAFGNELRRDDGFGIRVLEALEPFLEGRTEIELLNVGTGGVRLAQHLLGGYEHLIVIDAIMRGAAPGTLHVLEVDEVTAAETVDLHLATPSKALSLARELKALPDLIHLVGCEPGEVDELSLELTEPVGAAVMPAAQAVLRLLDVSADPNSPLDVAASETPGRLHGQ